MLRFTRLWPLLALVWFSACRIPRADPLVVAFYNVENLFDTDDYPHTRDEDFTPSGKLAWDETRYRHKCAQLARVIQALGPPHLIGLAEVENRQVLMDLAATAPLATQAWEVAHFDSPDERGIDVGLLYRASHFRLLDSRPIPVATERPTRDILAATLCTAVGDTLYVFVNHWPSRVGGVEKTAPLRELAALTLRHTLDSLLSVRPQALLLVMGDFNDNPSNHSVAEVLAGGALINPFHALHLLGAGSYHFRGQWDLLDQIMYSPGLLAPGAPWQRTSAGVLKERWMLYNDPKFGPSPNRSYGGPNYYGGFSDHLPVWLHLHPARTGRRKSPR
jgi:predicted extracellular nuclease